MKKLLISIICFLAGANAVVYAETLTLTTYYPTPFGAYDQLRLVPRAVQSNPCTPGTMYVRSDTGDMEFCSSGSTWGPAPGAWRITGTTIHPATLTNNVAIGTSSATTNLQIKSTNSHPVIIETSAPAGEAAIEMKFNGNASAHWEIGPEANLFKIEHLVNPMLGNLLVIENGGDVGIGTVAPEGKLHIVHSGNDGLNSALILENSATTQEHFIHFRTPGVLDWVMGIEDTDDPDTFAQDFVIWTGSTHAFVVQKATGNVAIGTTEPTTTLDVNGQITIRGGSPGAGKVLTSDASGTATWAFITYAP